MINIRPVSDLRNKYPEIEDVVLKGNEAVFLTKNGYGLMVVMSIEKYAQLMKKIDEAKALQERFGNVDIEKALDESEEQLENSNTKYLTHDEIFSKARRIINNEE